MTSAAVKLNPGPVNMGKIIATQALTVPEALERHACPAGRKAKVTIIRTFLVYPKNSISLLITPPLSIASLGATLRAAGYDIDLLDAQGEGVERIWPSECGRYNVHGLDIDQTVARIDPETDIIGISILFSVGWPIYKQLIRQIRQRFPAATIVLGGEHVSALGMFVMDDCREIDFGIAGEGELSFLSLVHARAVGGDISGIQGLFYRDADGKVISNGSSPRIADIDNLPLPAWDKIDLNRYFQSDITAPGGVSGTRPMPVYGNRGCPYRCTFCSNVNMWTPRYQTRDPVKLVDEIEGLVKNYQIDVIQICDLTMVVNPKWIEAFCLEMKRRNLKLKWEMPSGTRSEALDEKTLQLMWDVGNYMLVYAPESGSKRVLKDIRKQVDLEHMKVSIASALKIGYRIRMGFIVGLPQETRMDILRTILFSCRLAVMGVQDSLFSLFSPYPGSPMFYDLLADGTIKAIDDDYFHSLAAMLDTTQTFSFCKAIGSTELGLWRYAAFLSFYLTGYIAHPGRIVRLIGGLLSKKEFQPQNVLESRLHQRFVRRRMLASGRQECC